MEKLLNRRLVYLEQSSFDKTPLTIEEVDNYVKYSKTLELSSENIILYGDFSGALKVGREVVGHDSELIHHDKILVTDFPIQECTKHEFDFGSYSELMETLNTEKKKNDQIKSFRISFLNYERAIVHFFNLEK
jgi:hypothetical protein